MDGLPGELQDLDPVRLAALRALSASVLGLVRLTRGRRIRIGRGVIANHRLIVWGPGMIEIGDRANLYAHGQGRRTRIMSRRPEALVRIGENVWLGGSHIQADTLVDIGRDCVLSQCHVIDTDMHSLALDRRTNPDAPILTEPVILEPNVWVARGAAILRGVRVGEGSVVGYGAVVTKDVPPKVLVAGNPARVIRDLD